MSMFFENNLLLAEEDFKKNNIFCNLATSDGKCTIGFINTSKAYPKTLIKGNNLKDDTSRTVDLVLRKKSDEKKFNKIIIGDTAFISSNLDYLGSILDDGLIEVNEGEKEAAVATDTEK